MARFRETLPEETRECTVAEDMLEDFWGQPIFYGLVGNTIVVVSAGEDGRFTTDDDIGIPAPDAQHAETVNVKDVCSPW